MTTPYERFLESKPSAHRSVGISGIDAPQADLRDVCAAIWHLTSAVRDVAIQLAVSRNDEEERKW